MIRNLKVLGLALAAVFAMSAVAASAASAQSFLTSDGPVTLIGTQTGAIPEDNSLTADGGESVIECENAFYTGHKVDTTDPHELVPSKASAVTITPHYGACKADGFPATVDMNGCDYEFDLGDTIEEHVYDVTTTVHCPEGEDIEVTVFTGGSHAIRACTITITPETDYDGLHATDTTDGHIDITGTIEDIVLHKSGFGCASETLEDGVLHVDATITGKDSKEQDTDISLSHS